MQSELRQAASRHNDRLNSRLDRLVPDLMERAGLDAWVLIAREYNEDPVLASMLPAEWLKTARRRTILVFVRSGRRVQRHAVARYAVGDAFPSAWDPSEEPDQWKRLVQILEEAEPETIGINSSDTFALADGLAASERDTFHAALPHHMIDRVVSAESAAVGWLETRLPEERQAMALACATAHDFLKRALSFEVIKPKVSTTKDVEWWLRDQVRAAGYDVWFHPMCSVQRAGDEQADFSKAPGEELIVPGDLVHIDFGIVDDGYCTDQQQHAYVLSPDETAPPDDLVLALAKGNRLQDLLMAEFAKGRTGNEVLAAARSAAEEAGIDGLIYSHPIGVHGHAAGPTIGLWDQQGGVPGAGDYPILPNTAYSIELSASYPVESWGGQTVQIMLEEDAWFDGTDCTFLDDRQTRLWLI